MIITNKFLLLLLYIFQIFDEGKISNFLVIAAFEKCTALIIVIYQIYAYGKLWKKIFCG